MRTKSSYETYIYEFLKFDIAVSCPSCLQKALIKTNDFTFHNLEENEIRIICTNCGYSKKLIEKPSSILYSSQERVIEGRHFIIGAPIDPIFYLPLWYKANFGGNILWAYNEPHLEFLETHIEAKLRERTGLSYTNKGLGSRLPKWMTSSKNREEILKSLRLLKNKKK